MENKMKELAQLVDLELEEEFKMDNWSSKYKITKDGFMYWSDDYQQWNYTNGIEELFTGKRRIVKLPKPILDEKEKEYLSAVIKPFRDNVAAIVKRGDYGYDNYSCIRIIVKQNGNLEWISLPIFKTETMYNGMEIDKDYTLDELRL